MNITIGWINTIQDHWLQKGIRNQSVWSILQSLLSTLVHSYEDQQRWEGRSWAAVRLFHRNLEVDAYNNENFVTAFESFVDDKMIGYSRLTEVTIVRRNLNKKSVVSHSYMITLKVDVEDDLLNGGCARLIMGQVCRVKKKQYDICKREALDAPRSANITFGSSVKCRHKEFPVVFARWHIRPSLFMLRSVESQRFTVLIT